MGHTEPNPTLEISLAGPVVANPAARGETGGYADHIINGPPHNALICHAQSLPQTSSQTKLDNMWEFKNTVLLDFLTSVLIFERHEESADKSSLEEV